MTRSSQLVFQGGAVLLATDEIVRFPVEVEALGDLLRRHSGSSGDQVRLQQQRLLPFGRGPGEEDDPGDIARARRNHRRDDASFAVADDADFSRVDLFAALEKRHGGFGIAGEIRGGGLVVVAGRLADTAFVVTQHRDAFAREVIGENQERAMAGVGFIAIERARADKQDGRGKGPRASRDRQRGSE